MSSPLINIVIPVYNERAVLAASIGALTAFLNEHCRYPWHVVIADNGSTDGTFALAHELAGESHQVSALHVDRKGRGGAIKWAWQQSPAQVLSYMDVDLSSDLAAFPALIESLVTGDYDFATGSRLLDPTLTSRSPKREFISRGYNLLVKALFGTRFSDAQCGFKAISRPAANELLPLVQDNAWFMDTELLVLAEKLGFRIFDLPVRWVEDPDSRVRLWRTACQDLAGLIRLRRNLHRLKRRQLSRSRLPRRHG